MNKSLERLCCVITEIVSPAPGHSTNEEEYLLHCRALIEEECNGIKNFLVEEVVHQARKERVLELLIQHYQSSLIHLIDTVAAWDTQKDANASALKSFLLLKLDDILSHIRCRYARYFNLNEKVPLQYLQLHKQQLAAKTKQLQKHLQKLGLAAELVTIVLQPLQTLISGKSHNSTYRDLSYFKMMLEELLSFTAEASCDKLCFEFCQVLIYINFNAHRFINYYIEHMFKAINYDDMPAKLETYSLQLKALNQLLTKPNAELITGSISVKQALQQWLQEEVIWLEKRAQYTLFPHRVPSIVNDEPALPKQKIATTLSVDDLACFIKLLVESGIIANKTDTELITIISQTFSTRKTENIAYKSLYNKYHSINPKSPAMVKDLLFKMIDTLRKLSLFFIMLPQFVPVDIAVDLL
ncbi:MAG: hypothetical protein KGO81_05920 [Bacteroidota bacterium]|nr:hypothetical protein [Bacteroidota bacterium]